MTEALAVALYRDAARDFVFTHSQPAGQWAEVFDPLTGLRCNVTGDGAQLRWLFRGPWVQHVLTHPELFPASDAHVATAMRVLERRGRH